MYLGTEFESAYRRAYLSIVNMQISTQNSDVAIDLSKRIGIGILDRVTSISDAESCGVRPAPRMADRPAVPSLFSFRPYTAERTIVFERFEIIDFEIRRVTPSRTAPSNS